MKIALAQLHLSKDMDANADKSFSVMETVARKGADLVCFPEIQLSPFFPQHRSLDVTDYVITIDHEIVKTMRDICAANNLLSVPNFYLEENGCRYDASPMINSDGEILGISKMVHIVQAPHFFEQDYYQPSDSGFHVYETTAVNIGIVICFDRHLPESIRTCALKGADIVVIPTANTKAEDMEMFEWEMRVSAMQNGVFIAMCNRVGKEGSLIFSGESLVIDPFGNIVAKADDEEQILYADIDLELVQKAQKDRPYIYLRRPEFYK